jgi:hypothetical protein
MVALRLVAAEAASGVTVWLPAAAHAEVRRQVVGAVVVRRAAARAEELVARASAACRQAAPDALVELPLVFPSMAVSVFHPDPPPPWPAPRPAARSAHSMQQMQTARP